MKYAVGLDLGDGESALCWLPTAGRSEAQLYARGTEGSAIVTAIARVHFEEDEDLSFTAEARYRDIIGEEAVLAKNARHFSVNFKTRPDPADLQTPQPLIFAQILLTEFFTRYPEVRRECVVYVGHPAGWDRKSVETYQKHFSAMDVPVRLVAESQSALVHVRDRRAEHRQAGGLDRVLVVDVGSSTTDFTFVDDLIPRNLQVGSDLGCREIDATLAEMVRKAFANDTKFIESLGQVGGQDMLLLLCRRAKEAQFAGARLRLQELQAGCDDKFTPFVVPSVGWLGQKEIPQQVVRAPGGWAERLTATLIEVRDQLGQDKPELIVLTGGGSRMPVVRQICGETFPDAVVEDDRDPAFTVARGLASTGRHRVAVERFRQEIQMLKDQPVFNDLIRTRLLSSFGEVRSVLSERLEMDLEQSKKPSQRLDELIREMAGMDHIFRKLRVELESSVTPLVLGICRSYGVRDDQFRLDFTVPDIVSSMMKARIRTAWRTMGFSQGVWDSATMVGQGGGVLLRGAVLAIRKAGAGPVLAAAAISAAAGGVVVGGAKGIEYLARRRLQTMLATAELEPTEVAKLVEQVAEAITIQMDARAVEIERFLAPDAETTDDY
ncbi:Hsp70 family protein [Streptomyces sp. NPDC059697]|uniref:Hsp70 family protein n=1 Tax=Streptomyces sp. NPDC059697 TaxID=3346912 RepID=UPI0036A87BE8